MKTMKTNMKTMKTNRRNLVVLFALGVAFSARAAWYDNPAVRASFTVDGVTSDSDPHYINKSSDDGLLMVDLSSREGSGAKTMIYSIADLKSASGKVKGHGKTVVNVSDNRWKGGAISSDLGVMIPGSGLDSASSLIDTDRSEWSAGSGINPLTFPDAHKLDGLDFGTSSAYLYSNADGGNVLYRWALPTKPYQTSANALTLSASKTTGATRIRNLSVHAVNGRELVYYGEGSGTSGCVWAMDVTDANSDNWTETEIVPSGTLGEFKDITNVKLSNEDSSTPILYVLSDAGLLSICQLDATGMTLVKVIRTLQKADIYDYANVYDVNYPDGKFRNFEVSKDGSCAFFVSKTEAGTMAVNVVSAPLALAPRTLTYNTTLGGAWANAASWKEKLAPRAGDTLVIPGNARLFDGDEAAVAEIGEIVIDAAATLTVTNGNALTIGGCVSGEGRLTKCGDGVLTLKRGSTCSGKLRVEAGTVNAAPPRGAFTWYKLTIRESWYGHNIRTTGKSAGDDNVGMQELMMFDVNGNRLSFAGFSVNTGNAVANLQPGQVTFDGNVIQTSYSGRLLDGLIDGTLDRYWLAQPMTRPTRADNPSSWFSIVVRFPEGTPEAVAYDLYLLGGGGRSASAWTMYGSADGMTWFELDKRDFDTATEPSRWASDGSADAVAAHVGGFPMVEDTSAFGFKNAAGVEVASGATLAAGRSELKLPLPSPLDVAPDGAHGHYTGFALPTDGLLNISVPLTWYRLTILETVGGKKVREGSGSTEGNIHMQEFALYDASGVRKNLGLGIDTRCNPALLGVGKVTYSRSGYNNYGNRDADKLFDDAEGTGWCISYGNSSTLPRRDKPATWVALTMRLADADPRVVSCDWADAVGATHDRTVLSWRLEGSADGQTWVSLDERMDFVNRRDYSKWWSDDSSFVAGANTRRTGIPLAMDGMKDLVSLCNFACAIDLDGCTDVKNMKNWTVGVNGVEIPGKHMAYRNGKLTLFSLGLILLVR